MASIMKRGNTYSVRYNYKDHAGKPCKGWETFKTKAEAQERKITVEKELLDGTFLVPNTMTVEEMLYKWIPIQSSKHKWSPKTYTQSVAMVQNLIVPYIGKRKVQDLRTYDIEQFYATLSQTPCGQYVHGVKQELTENQKKRLLSSTSIHEVHTLLKTAFSYAVDWDLIHKSPTPREAPKINTEERTIWNERTMLAALLKGQARLMPLCTSAAQCFRVQRYPQCAGQRHRHELRHIVAACSAGCRHGNDAVVPKGHAFHKLRHRFCTGHMHLAAKGQLCQPEAQLHRRPRCSMVFCMQDAAPHTALIPERCCCTGQFP